MRPTLGSLRRPLTLSLILALLALAGPVVAADLDVGLVVEQIFGDRQQEAFVAVVLNDPARQRYLALYLSTYLDLHELRAYMIPYASADRAIVDAALEQGDHATAFTSLLSSMRLSLGAKYVSDVNLDGISDEAVKLGDGTVRDGFHRGIFADATEADRAYRDWLARALELRES